MLRTCCLILCLVAGTRQLNITEFTVPRSVESGSDAELQCKFSLDADDGWLYVKWWWTPLYGSEDDRIPQLLYQRMSSMQPVVSRSRHNIKLGGNDTIIVTDMEYTDSGKYECEVSGLAEMRLHKELVVYSNGSGPMLNLNTTADGPDDDSEDDVTLECEANEVTPQPELTLSIDGSEVETITKEVTSSPEGLYSVRVNATVSKSTVIGAEVRCELFYVNLDISHPPFFDSQIYPSDAETTTEAVGDTTLLGATSETLQNLSDDCSPFFSSWILVAAAVPIHFYNLL